MFRYECIEDSVMVCVPGRLRSVAIWLLTRWPSRCTVSAQRVNNWPTVTAAHLLTTTENKKYVVFHYNVPTDQNLGLGGI